MHKRILYYLLLFTGFFTCNAFAQGSYITTDTSYVGGMLLLKGTARENAQFIRSKENDSVKVYSPHELAEYGFLQGKSFKSFTIEVNGQNKRFFFEKLYKGKISLYYLSSSSGISRYYVTKNDSLGLTAIPESRKAYTAFLKSYLKDCPEFADNIGLVRLQKSNLRRFFRDYEDCTISFLPRFRYGVVGGIAMGKYASEVSWGMLSLPDYQKDMAYWGGVFVDVPIGISYFTLHPEILYKQSSDAVAFKETMNREGDMIINSTSVNLPLLFRYNFFHLKHSPFLQIGPLYSRLIRNEALLYEYIFKEKEVFIDYKEVPVFSNNQGGLMIGGGMIFNSRSNYSFFTDVRYQKLFNIRHQSYGLTKQEVSFSLGMMF